VSLSNPLPYTPIVLIRVKFVEVPYYLCGITLCYTYIDCLVIVLEQIEKFHFARNWAVTFEKFTYRLPLPHYCGSVLLRGSSDVSSGDPSV
jgi:hypothetical protein